MQFKLSLKPFKNILNNILTNINNISFISTCDCNLSQAEKRRSGAQLGVKYIKLLDWRDVGPIGQGVFLPGSEEEENHREAAQMQ